MSLSRINISNGGDTINTGFNKTNELIDIAITGATLSNNILQLNRFNTTPITIDGFLSIEGTTNSNMEGNISFNNLTGINSFQGLNEAIIQFGDEYSEKLIISSTNLNDNSSVGISLLGDDYSTGMNIYGNGNLPISITTENSPIIISSSNANIDIDSTNIKIGNSNNTSLNFLGNPNTSVNFNQKTLTLNKYHYPAINDNGGDSGILIEEFDGSSNNITGFIKTTNNRLGWSIKSPNNSGIINLITPNNNYNILFPNKASGSTETFAMVSDITNTDGITKAEFSNYSGNTKIDIDNKLDNNIFNIYSGLTNTNIDAKLNISDFSNYTGNTNFVYTTDLTVSLSGGKTAGKYTNGQTINRIGKTPQEVMDDMYTETLFPTLTNPSISSVSLNVGNTLEVGTLIPTLTASATFNRGSINPQYTSSNPFRSGLPNNHLFSGVNSFTGNTASTSLTPSKTISNYIVKTGSNIFGIQVAYDAGVQPKDNSNNNYLSPLSAGSSSVSNATINGAYLRFYGSSNTTIPNTSAQVRVLSSTFNNTFTIIIPAGNTKIFFYYPSTMSDITDTSVKYVEGFNANVGNIFTKTTINVNDANGTPVSYKQYSTTLPAAESSNITYNITIS